MTLKQLSPSEMLKECLDFGIIIFEIRLLYE